LNHSLYFIKKQDEREADEADYAGIAYRVNRLAECVSALGCGGLGWWN